MTSKQWRLPLLGVSVLALAALACGLLPGSTLPGGEEEASGSAPAGNEGGGNGAPTGGEEVPLTYTGIEPGALSSYRSHFVMTFTGTDDSGEQVDMRYDVTQVFSSDPPASSLSVEAAGSGTPDIPGSMQFVQVGETSYMVSEGECLSFTGESNLTEDLSFTPDDFMAGGDFSRAQRVLPDEPVNGVLTRHYHFTQNEVQLEMGGLTSFSGDIWVAIDGGYVVRQVINAEGTALVFGGAQGKLSWTYDLLDVNAPVNIEPPPGCEAPAGAELPMAEDAYDLSSLGGMVSYSTASSVDDMVSFYTEKMAAQGWMVGQVSTDVPGLATMEFMRQGETATVLISESEGATSVLITVE